MEGILIILLLWAYYVIKREPERKAWYEKNKDRESTSGNSLTETFFKGDPLL